MKKFFLALIVLTLLTTPAFAQNRGALTNIYASWVNVTANSQKVFTLPNTSRDVYILNGDASNAICVDLRGGTIPNNCVTNLSLDLQGTPGIIQIPKASDIHLLSDYITGAISVKAIGGATASPVTVIVTY